MPVQQTPVTILQMVSVLQRKTHWAILPITTYYSDHLGGTNVITDPSGNLVERIKYYPFGEIREGGNEKYSFTGKEKDKLTDFYYFEARYYNPEFKHFTQADSIAPNLYDPQDLNRYAYVRNNPIKLTDPTGHVWWNPFTWFRKSEKPQEQNEVHASTGLKSQSSNSVCCKKPTETNEKISHIIASTGNEVPLQNETNHNDNLGVDAAKQFASITTNFSMPIAATTMFAHGLIQMGAVETGTAILSATGPIGIVVGLTVYGSAVAYEKDIKFNNIPGLMVKGGRGETALESLHQSKFEVYEQLGVVQRSNINLQINNNALEKNISW